MFTRVWFMHSTNPFCSGVSAAVVRCTMPVLPSSSWNNLPTYSPPLSDWKKSMKFLERHSSPISAPRWARILFLNSRKHDTASLFFCMKYTQGKRPYPSMNDIQYWFPRQSAGLMGPPTSECMTWNGWVALCPLCLKGSFLDLAKTHGSQNLAFPVVLSTPLTYPSFTICISLFGDMWARRRWRTFMSMEVRVWSVGDVFKWYRSPLCNPVRTTFWPFEVFILHAPFLNTV